MSTDKKRVKDCDQVDDKSLAAEDCEILDRKIEDHDFEAEADEEFADDRFQFSCDDEEIAFDIYIDYLVEDR